MQTPSSVGIPASCPGAASHKDPHPIPPGHQHLVLRCPLHRRLLTHLGSDGLQGFPGGASGKEPTCSCRRHKRLGFDLWVGKIPGGGSGTHGPSCTWQHPPTWAASSLPWAPASPGLPPHVRASSLLWLTLPFCSGHCSGVEASLAPPHSIPSGQNFLEKGRQLILVVSYYTHPSPFCRYFHVPRAS